METVTEFFKEEKQETIFCTQVKGVEYEKELDIALINMPGKIGIFSSILKSLYYSKG